MRVGAGGKTGTQCGGDGGAEATLEEAGADVSPGSPKLRFWEAQDLQNPIPTRENPSCLSPCAGTSASRFLSLTQALRIDLVLGKNDDHRAAANFTIVVHFRRHFIQMRDGDFKDFKAGRASDFGEFHGACVAPIRSRRKTISSQVVPPSGGLLFRPKPTEGGTTYEDSASASRLQTRFTASPPPA